MTVREFKKPAASTDPPAGPAIRVPDLPDLADLPALRTATVTGLSRIAAGVLRRRWDVRLHGAEHVPTDGPVLVACNHLAVLDGLLAIALSPRPTYALAKQELFTGSLGRLLEATGQIPVQRRTVDKRAVRRCLQVLTSGGALAVFPEGVRGLGDFQHAFGGAAYLAMVTGAPIVPVAILGSREPGQTTKQMPRRGQPMHMVYGPPILIPQLSWPRRRTEVVTLTEDLRIQLAAHVTGAQELTGLRLPGPPA
ncbi:MAG: 1-acyl-sn-glycerol-3-phosphate acyltransferase [Propionibacteriales bacterium]|nr:1-acyl-sn-glycerol-3-phosphate acyltransferase [Propionibacteriales bacterium]